MGKCAYLIISDLHDLNTDKGNRVDYQGEVRYAKEKIVETITKYKQNGCKVVLIFLGDIFDRGYTSEAVFGAVAGNNYFIYVRQLVDAIYSVMGNHEFSFYNNNPFYTLITSIESEKVRAMSNKLWTPQGTFPVIQVPDVVEDGNVRFVFNHYDTGITEPPTDKVNIGLIHQDVVCNEIITSVSANTKADIWTKSKLKSFDAVRWFDNYKACFFGHNHKIYGSWVFESPRTLNETELYYLASVVPVAHSEINDASRERDIPAVIVDNGEFAGIEHNTFLLKLRSEVVKESVVITAQETRKKVIERKKAFDTEYGSDDPIKNIQSLLSTPLQHNIFNSIYTSGTSSECQRIITKISKVLQ